MNVGLWGFLLAVAHASAQHTAWQLPARGAAEYIRVLECGSALAPTMAQAAAVRVAGAVPERYLPKVPPAPFVCQGELDREQRAVTTPVRDLRDVLRLIACDRTGRTSWRVPRMLPFGDLLVTGSVANAADGGRPLLRGTIARRDPAPLPGDEPGLRKDHLQPVCDTEVLGTWSLERDWDADAGVLREFRGQLTLCCEEGPRRCRRIEVRDCWRLQAVHGNQDAWFRERVRSGVRRGAEWLARTIAGADATFLQDKDDKPPRSFGSGRLALAIQTLCHAGRTADDPAVLAAWRELVRRELVDSYALGSALQALAARLAPPRELERLHDGTLLQRAPRVLDAADRRLASGWLHQLLKNVDKRADPHAILRFNYTAAARYDTSVQQYGMLGLDAAALCGLQLPDQSWQAAAQHLLAVQGNGNGRVRDYVRTTHREALAGEEGTRLRAPTRGFAYQDSDEPAYGSMTAAGVTGLVLARSGLQAQGRRPTELRALDAAIDGGFAWLAAEFSVRANPGCAVRAHAHWYYWLYGLERVCELCGLEWLDGRDWYYEGALQLLAQQEPDGSFRSDDSLRLDATCFALLFLAKATAPVATGR